MFSERGAGILACLILLAGCSKKQDSFERIAIPPFENLAADPGLDWMSRGFSELVSLQFTGLPAAHPLNVTSQRDAAAVGATEILQGYFYRQGGRLRVEAVLEDAGSHQTAKSASASGPEAEGILPLARSLALQLDGGARPLGALNDTALRAFVEARTAANAAAGAKAFERAAAADPSFGAAYVAWVQWLLSHGDRAGAREVITAAARRGSQIPEVERAHLGLLEAMLQGDRAAQYRALVALSKVTPADSEVFRNLGELDLMAHRYPAAVDSYTKAAARSPEDVLLLNQLGYAQSYARDLEGASKTLRRYRELRPRDANPSDSLGDVHYYLGRFSEAEKFYLEASGKDPSFLGGGDLYKAAWARLMTGDRKGADQFFGRFLEFRRAAGDSLVEYRQAEWEYLSGRRKEAETRLEQFVKAQAAPGAVSLAWSELSIWRLASGDRARAHEYAGHAVAAAPNPGSQMLAEMCRFLAQPNASASEWALRAQRAFPNPAQAAAKQYALAYALLLDRQFAAAVPALRQLYDQTPPSSSEPLNVLLAWALIESKQAGQVGDLLNTYPIPRPEGEQPFYCLGFPRLFELRGIALR